MYKSIIIPNNIIENGIAFFPRPTLMKGQKILEYGRISISFTKTRENRFIVSGLEKL